MKSIYILSIVLLLSSCMGLLETEPQGQISDEQLEEMIKNDPEKVLGPMLAAAVGNIQHFSRDGVVTSKGFKAYNLALDMMGNDMILFATSGWFQEEYEMRNYREQIYARSADFWTLYYKLVYQANQILDLIPEGEVKDQTKVYQASALTLRAMSYYYLISLYQDAYLHGGKDKAGVPLYLSAKEGSKGRTPAAEVWGQIVEDLENAIRLFEETNYSSTTSKTDIDISVAHVIFARTALAMGNWKQAIASASAVMQQYPTLINETDYTTSGFQSLDLSEVIFGYKYDIGTSYGNSSYASHISVVTVGGYGGSLGGWKGVDRRLYDRMADSDYRKKNFLAEPTPYVYSAGEKDELHVTFPAMTNMKFASKDFYQDEIFMRVSEMYFIKAEAEARNSQEGAARQTLYDLVHERDEQYQMSAASGSALLEEIALHRRIELWGEGFEFLENKRQNKGVDRMDSPNHLYKLIVPTGVGFTFQIPLSQEIESNPFINTPDQNP